MDIQKHRQTERRHMIAAKDALAAGLAVNAARGDDLQNFYAACVDYLVMSLGRFHGQGFKNFDHLRPLVPESDAESRAALADLETTLTTSRDEIAKLKRAMDVFLTQGLSGQKTFEAAARTFVDFYNSTLAQRKNPAQVIIERYVPSEDYWKLTDDFTQEVIDTETRLFARIEEAAPAGVSVGYVES